MAWVRVDTQTILTIDDVVITRSQRISVRHMTDASIDHPRHHHHHQQQQQQQQQQQHQKNKSLLSPPGHSQTSLETIPPGGIRRPSIHKTWQLIIRDVQSSDAGLYVCVLLLLHYVLHIFIEHQCNYIYKRFLFN